jgi:hypothetical protein
MTALTTAPTRSPDRRVERSRQAILDGTRQLLAHDGAVGSLTVEAVAARCGGRCCGGGSSWLRRH